MKALSKFAGMGRTELVKTAIRAERSLKAARDKGRSSGAKVERIVTTAVGAAAIAAADQKWGGPNGWKPFGVSVGTLGTLAALGVGIFADVPIAERIGEGGFYQWVGAKARLMVSKAAEAGEAEDEEETT